MKYPVVGALLFSIGTATFAQAASTPAVPTVGAQKLVQVKPTAPTDCRLVGAVKGTKLWAGDCVANEIRGAATDSEAAPSSSFPAVDAKQ